MKIFADDSFKGITLYANTVLAINDKLAHFVAGGAVWKALDRWISGPLLLHIVIFLSLVIGWEILELVRLYLYKLEYRFITDYFSWRDVIMGCGGALAAGLLL